MQTNLFSVENVKRTIVSAIAHLSCVPDHPEGYLSATVAIGIRRQYEEPTEDMPFVSTAPRTFTWVDADDKEHHVNIVGEGDSKTIWDSHHQVATITEKGKWHYEVHDAVNHLRYKVACHVVNPSSVEITDPDNVCISYGVIRRKRLQTAQATPAS